MDNNNNKQNIAIAELKRDVSWLKNELTLIKEQVFNHIPHQIDDIKTKLTYGFIIGIVAIVLTQILLRFFE